VEGEKMGAGYINIEDTILHIKKRPKMYVYEARMDNVYHYLSGFLLSNLRSSEAQDIDHAFKRDFNGFVEQWAYDNKGLDFRRKVILWHRIISACTNSDEDAINLFYQISEEFFEAYHMENG